MDATTGFDANAKAGKGSGEAKTARRASAPPEAASPRGKARAQVPRRVTHARLQAETGRKNPRAFDYALDYRKLDLRAQPELYRVGVGEQGVLLVEPYKGELVPLWRFKTPDIARASAEALRAKFEEYKAQGDFVGMDMARKFLQMGYTRSRRYANRASGRKYDEAGQLLPFDPDPVKAESAAVFRAAWEAVEADPEYATLKAAHKARHG